MKCRTYNGFVLVSDFDFHLPPELIAQHPPASRSAARMLHLQGESLRDTFFREFPELLRPDDLLVFNDTRVLPARLYGHRSGNRAQRLSSHNPAAREFLHGKIEVLLTRRLPGPEQEQLWEALVHPGRKIMPGERLYFDLPEQTAGAGGYAATDVSPAAKWGNAALPAAGAGHLLEAEVLERGEFGQRTLRFVPVPDFFARLEALGHIPLPPYIDRPDEPEDRERYQTVFARESGSVAAPTAGLHFTPEILERIRERGIESASVTLHVGLGTFAPIRTEVVEQHKIHSEWYQISADTAEKIARARREGRRVVAVGTTTVRTLEYAAQRAEQEQRQNQLPQARMGHPEAGGPHLPAVGKCGDERGEIAQITAQSGEANIFIYPGYRFRVVDAMLTNFHLPKSTLLMLVCAFAGRERVLAAYEHAVRERYRFFSYGDCMFLE
jgi:S-adenosylmethionine:tRNA ribosyltransferase-isomerase